MTSAIIKTGGKQYKVTVGQLVKIEKLDAEVGNTVTFDQVLAVVEDGTMKIGNPLIAAQSVTAEVVEQGKGKKIRVFTYKSKKRQRRTLGHRQMVTTVRINAIGGAKKEAPKAAVAQDAAAPIEKAPVKKAVAPKKVAAK
ncbi:MAG TPA: 50S ribosomal protein L21 [Verrucomicrobiae bacterium]|nr:50S ribosomal protein L21 [Verrucomicrobiae bacterium]